MIPGLERDHALLAPHTVGQLRARATTTEPRRPRAHASQEKSPQ